MEYKDPLHFSYDQLTVYYNGQPRLILNKGLLDQQNAWGNLEELKEVHWLKFVLFEMIAETDNVKELKELAKDVTVVEFELQKLWGFTPDAAFHRFWEYPKCTCPTLDNIDSYPHRSYISGDCPLHGQE